ncbi:MAG: hypothetical protein WBV77_06020 [Solirubrobacteraceae bacterium]
MIPTTLPACLSIHGMSSAREDHARALRGIGAETAGVHRPLGLLSECAQLDLQKRRARNHGNRDPIRPSANRGWFVSVM